MREQPGQPPRPVAVEPSQRPVELTQRLPRLRPRFGIHQVGHRLGLGQVELVVEERPPGELPRLGQPRPSIGPDRRHQGVEHGPAAMQMQFHNIFAGKTVWRREIQNQGLIQQQSACRIMQSAQHRLSRRRQGFSGQISKNGTGPHARQTHHRNAGTSPATGQGINRLGIH